MPGTSKTREKKEKRIIDVYFIFGTGRSDVYYRRI